ncbi:MAG: hypothetical protein IJP69_01865 [Synergistaceae bacterium]|nr:hypothetical protein [Synergistaceae bacterium]
MSVVFATSGAFAAYYDNNTGNSWDDAYIIGSVEDFKLMRDRVNSYSETGKYYKLNSDIDLTNEINWIGIGKISFEGANNSFKGHFDGQNHVIKINSETGINALFHDVTTSTDVAIKNLNVQGTVQESKEFTSTSSLLYIGGIVKRLQMGTIENCNFTGTVRAIATNADKQKLDDVEAGGIVGRCENGTIRNCKFSGTVSATANNWARAGGIVAFMSESSVISCETLSQSTISVSTAYDVSSATPCVGGIVAGFSGANVTQCISNATLSGGKYQGAIIGYSFANGIEKNISGNRWSNTEYIEIGNDTNTTTEQVGTETTTQTETPTELNVAIIAPVELSDDIIQKLADNISVDRSEIKLLTSRDFTTANPPEPTQAMREQVKNDNYEFMAKLNTITVSEDGYYVFAVTVSDDLVGTKVSDLRLFYAESSDFTGSSLKASFGLMGVLNGVTGGFEVSNFLGVKLDTVPKQFLATMFLSASKSITVYILKILLFLAGCNAGFGILGLSVGGFLIWKFFRRHS